VAELRFRVGAIFPADNPTARYLMAVSIVLGDIRSALAQAGRADAADHERLYFRRLLDLHVREGLRLAVSEHRDRDDVRRFVSILPEEARTARAALEQAVEDGGAPDADTFGCSGMLGETARLRSAIEQLADTETGYSLVGDEKRADYADLVVAQLLEGAGERILEELVTFMEHAEAAWLRPWRG
jgi:hypothetical protein